MKPHNRGQEARDAAAGGLAGRHTCRSHGYSTCPYTPFLKVPSDHEGCEPTQFTHAEHGHRDHVPER